MAAYPLDNNFTYHKPFGNQAERYEELREMAKGLATTYLEMCPDRSRTLPGHDEIGGVGHVGQRGDRPQRALRRHARLSTT